MLIAVQKKKGGQSLALSVCSENAGQEAQECWLVGQAKGIERFCGDSPAPLPESVAH